MQPGRCWNSASDGSDEDVGRKPFLLVGTDARQRVQFRPAGGGSEGVFAHNLDPLLPFAVPDLATAKQRFQSDMTVASTHRPGHIAVIRAPATFQP